MELVDVKIITCDGCGETHAFSSKYRRRFCSPRCRERYWNKVNTAYHRKRALVFSHLGNKCVRCGFSDPRALQIDHVNGGGVQEAKKRPNWHSRYREMLALPRGEKYQLLCANCNWIKRHENNEQPGAFCKTAETGI